MSTQEYSKAHVQRTECDYQQNSITIKGYPATPRLRVLALTANHLDALLPIGLQEMVCQLYPLRETSVKLGSNRISLSLLGEPPNRKGQHVPDEGTMLPACARC
jgi:hypothetical protein